jgi:hypothetical protein
MGRNFSRVGHIKRYDRYGHEISLTRLMKGAYFYTCYWLAL